MKMLIIILALLTPQMAFARIGETMAECIERYGEPSSTLLSPNSGEIELAVFTKGDFEIQVMPLNGVCQCITYTKKDKTAIEAETVKLILSKNHDSWRLQSRVHPLKLWYSEQTRLGKYKATHVSGDRIILIVTQQYTDDRDKKKSEKREKNLDGF